MAISGLRQSVDGSVFPDSLVRHRVTGAVQASEGTGAAIKERYATYRVSAPLTATMGTMADARSNRSLSPGIQPARDAARLELRASDADRDRTAAVLGNALATGRLTTSEHAERLDAAYTATTLGDLAPLTRDLPADDATGTGVGAVDRAEVAARFSKVIRSGRWVAGRRTRLTAHFGALVVNLADAVLPGREITLEIDAFCGKLILTVPAGAQVIDEGGALFAKRAVYGRPDPDDADGPVIRLVGEARFSKVAVHRGRYDPYVQWRHWQQQP
jgi:hypothetical protein